MQHKYAIIFPACHGGNFLGELLTLGEDCYSCNANLLESTTADRLAACTTRYTTGGDWIVNEGNLRSKHISDSEKIDLIQGHVYNVKLAGNFKIIVADAFSSNVGVLWAEAGRRYLFSFSDCYGMHHNEDEHYNTLKSSKLPMLYVDMTEFLNPVFPTTYYETLCHQLGISTETASATKLHKLWFEKRVKSYHPGPAISDKLQQLWSVRRQKQLHDRYLLQYNTAVTIKNMNLKEIYHRVKGPNWPEYDISEDFFNQLPAWVKQECINSGIDWAEIGAVKIYNYTELAVKYRFPIDPYYQYTHMIPNLLFINQHTL